MFQRQRSRLLVRGSATNPNFPKRSDSHGSRRMDGVILSNPFCRIKALKLDLGSDGDH